MLLYIVVRIPESLKNTKFGLDQRRTSRRNPVLPCSLRLVILGRRLNSSKVSYVRAQALLDSPYKMLEVS